MNREQHEGTADCADMHCVTHQVDEPTEGFRLCAECGHMFLTAKELIEADFEAQDYAINGLPAAVWDEIDEAFLKILDIEVHPPSRTVEPQRQDPSRIFMCPHCTHDF